MAKDIEQLRSEITEYSLNTEMPFPVQNIDLKINPAHISLDILDAVSSSNRSERATPNRSSDFTA